MHFCGHRHFSQKSSAEVTIEVGYDEAALESKIESVQALNQEQTDPQSAYPKYDGNSFVVEPEVYGTKVDVDTFKAKSEGCDHKLQE